MAYKLGEKYYIVSHAGNGLMLNVYGDEVVYDSSRVCLYYKEDVNAQKWIVKSEQNYGKIYTALEGGNRYALNIYSYSYPICTMYRAAGNDYDSLLDLITIDAEKQLYYIKLRYYNLYLYADGNYLNANVLWKAYPGSDAYIWKLVDIDGEEPPVTDNDILKRYTAPPTTTGSSSLRINNIPDIHNGGIENNVQFHPGCGLPNGLNFDDSDTGEAVKSVLQIYIKKVFGYDTYLTDAQTCYYLYGERLYDDNSSSYHAGVDISHYRGAPIYSLFAGKVVYASYNNYGTVGIEVPELGIVTNYLHMNNLQVTANNNVIVPSGTLIGFESGKGGLNQGDYTFGSHLHFEIRPKGAPLGPASLVTKPTTALVTILPYGYMNGNLY